MHPWLLVPAINYKKIAIGSITVSDFTIQLSLSAVSLNFSRLLLSLTLSRDLPRGGGGWNSGYSAVFVTWVRELNAICPCSFRLARLVARLFTISLYDPKFDHISSSLFHLHWLPVAYLVHFEWLLLLLLLTIKAHGTLKTFYMPTLLQLIV